MPNYLSKHKKQKLPKYFLENKGKTTSFDFEGLRVHLKGKETKAVENFEKNRKRANQWLRRNGVNLAKIRETSQKTLSGGIVLGGLLLSAGSVNSDHLLPSPKIHRNLLASKSALSAFGNIKNMLSFKLRSVLPENMGPLSDRELDEIQEAIKETLGIDAKYELDGNRLNLNYGFIGGEQHLKRYPGDTLALHDEFTESGMAPGLGAFGYFANSASEFGGKEWQMEKYYVVTQTFLIPDWDRKFTWLKDWLKFRKVLVVNPNTGDAVVAVIGDSGPATWTGKQFGGSPEVMHHIGYGTGPRKGEIIMLFIDDPNDEIPLGPVRHIEEDLGIKV